MEYSAGDRIRITTEKETLEGTLMPTPELQEKKVVIIKLNNGYNIGIANNKIKKIELIKKYKVKKSNKEKASTKKGLPTISILHTGGTIASKVDYQTGGVIARFTPKEILGQFPELVSIANIKSRLVRNMFSEDMRFAHYNLIAEEIKKEIGGGTKGIIITHGTDTLHYSSAALAFILEGLSIPIVLVGAQRSSDRGSSDAGMNLVCAAKFIANTDFAEVAICMHSSMSDDFCYILPATKSRKLHTSRRDAFQPINDKPWAKVYYDDRQISFINNKYNKRNSKKLKLKLVNPDLKVGILRAHPNMSAEEVKFYSGFDGLVLEGTGLGQFPVSEIDKYTKEHTEILSAIKKLIDTGTIVVMAPQTIFGRIQMNVYASGRELLNVGVLGNYSDMTTETTFIKLAWLLSNYPKEKVKMLIGKNLRGEINSRIEPEMFLD
ncbi:Glu-tRNA(Gln) amidotransferase subunit GatD [Candidatus Woesearchaeota archaeon]|nr:Glu-tRNA(Gln) amidotransferase subunit GatD [Candidatus Woesearchaeota archaeon]